jgi:hypothetical protein
MISAKRPGQFGLSSALALVGTLLLTACLGGAAKPPEITLTEPQAGTALNVGQSIFIVGTATGDAISRVDVIIDGTTYATLNAPDKSKGVPSFPINVPWTPLAAGTHAIQLKAYGPPDDKLLTQSEPLVLNAQAAAVEATPTAEVPPTPAPVPTQAPPAQPQPPAAGQQPAPAATQAPAASGAPSLTVTNEFVNVRTGPDTVYDKIGELQQGQTAPVKGKSADGRWWQISFAGGTGGVGWVINDYVQANGAALNVPVASAPPRPVVVVPTQAPAPPVLVPLATQPPPQVAPAPVQGQLVGPLGVLRVESNPVASGATAWATWNIPNFRSGEVTAPRTIRLRWTDTGGAVQEDTITLQIAGQAVAGVPTTVVNAECNENNPDWQAGRNNNPTSWTFCKRKDLEYVGDSPGNIGRVDRSDKVYTMAWDVYGVKGVYLVFEPNSTQGPAAPNGKTLPTTGTGPLSFKINDFDSGCYRITLRLDTNRDNRTDFGEKILCIGVGTNPSPTSAPNPTSAPPPGQPTPLP